MSKFPNDEISAGHGEGALNAMFSAAKNMVSALARTLRPLVAACVMAAPAAATAQADPSACNVTAVNADANVRTWKAQQQADAARFCPNMIPDDLAHYTSIRDAVNAALFTNHCAMDNVGLTDVQTVDKIPCKPFDLKSLPPGAALDLIDRLGGAIPNAINNLSLTAGLKTAMKIFPDFALNGVDSLTDFPTDRDAAWASYYTWLQDMGYTPNLPAAAAGAPAPSVTPDTEWACPAPVAAPIAKCHGYLEAAVATVRPIVERVQASTVRVASAPPGTSPAVTAYEGDAAQSATLVGMATATTPSATAGAPATFDHPLHRRLMYAAAAWQSLNPKYQAFYQAEWEGREALSSLPADAAGLEPLKGQQVTVFKWGQEAVTGKVRNTSDANQLIVNVDGTDQTFLAAELNGTPAVTGAASTAATPASVRVFVDWPEAWREAREAVNFHGRARVLNPVDLNAGLQAFIGYEVEVVNADGTSAVGVLEAVDLAASTYTLRNRAATPFNPNRTIFFAGVKEGSGALSPSERLSIGATALGFAGKGNGVSVAGAGGGVTANYNDLFPHVDGELTLGYAGHDSSSGRATDRGANPSVPVMLATLKPHLTLGPVDLGIRAGGGAMAGGGAVQAGLFAAGGENHQFEVGLGYLGLFGARATHEERLGNPLPDHLDAHTAMATLTFRERFLRWFK